MQLPHSPPKSLSIETHIPKFQHNASEINQDNFERDEQLQLRNVISLFFFLNYVLLFSSNFPGLHIVIIFCAKLARK